MVREPALPVWERVREVCMTLQRMQFQRALRTKQSPNAMNTMAGSGCHGSAGDGGMWRDFVSSANERAGLWAAVWICAAPVYS